MVTTKIMIGINPLIISISIIALSIITAVIIFKTTMSRWLAFVLILTFSSGIITLFIYASSLSPNEKTKTKKHRKFIVLIIIAATIPHSHPIQIKESIKIFSNQVTIMIIITVLIATMVSISIHGYSPYQPISSNF